MDTIIEGLSAASSLVSVRLMTGAEIRDASYSNSNIGGRLVYKPA